ncbi:MAG: hypothetical protein AB7Q81_06265 [Gammaproteobacteria bacterium]
MVLGLSRKTSAARGMVASVAEVPRPVLHLSGSRLRSALEAAIAGCEQHGGVERYIAALELKSRLFRDALLGADPRAVELGTLVTLAAFMPTVRRRLAPMLESGGLAYLRTALGVLLDGREDTRSTDQRLAACRAQFPDDRDHRWVRDFAAEVLHNVDPERYPLMTRWVWDARANTGALREIWFGENVDHLTIPAADDYATFLVLREELAVFLSDNGFFRDINHYVDLLLAEVYAEYICAQGGTYLRTDFATPEDPMQHTRRMLGLDGVKAGSARLRAKALEGQAFVLDEQAAQVRVVDLHRED